MIRFAFLALLCVVVAGCTDVSAPAATVPPCRFQVASFGVVVAPELVHDGILRCRVSP